MDAEFNETDLRPPQRVTIETPRPITTRLSRAQMKAHPDLLLWWLIEDSTEGLSFKNYLAFMDFVLCGARAPEEGLDPEGKYEALKKKRFLPFTDTDAYRLLKVASEAFLAVNCGVNLHELPTGPEFNDLLSRTDAIDTDDIRKAWFTDYLQTVNGARVKTLPYLALIRRKLPDAPIKQAAMIFGEKALPEDCYGIIQEKLTNPCLLELIWSYWHEQGMLVQTMNAISRRFQNIRGAADRDPLAMMELDPLRPLNNLLWGYVQDEQHRLSLVRRAYEYDHHYGLTIEGKAVPVLRPADSRSKFLEAFHTLLYLSSVFYKQDDDTTVIADGFPVLNALKDVHMLLAEGAHNQFGDLPTTARIEMLMEQWLLARPEFREALPTRIMVAYPEPWMDRVDAMKRLQGWIDTSITHFHNLAVFGEQILLSVRYGSWSEINDPTQAAIWARYWRAPIQGYIHAYRTVTGADVTADVTQSQNRELVAAQPSVLLRRRLQGGSAAPMLPAPASAPALVAPGFRERRMARK